MEETIYNPLNNPKKIFIMTDGICIENKHTLPSMTGFMYICEYFNITPSEFFDANSRSPSISHEIATEAAKLSPKQAEHILLLIKDLNEK